MQEGVLEKAGLLNLVSSHFETEASMVRHFLHPPLYNTNFGKSFGTLYTVLYNVNQGIAQIHWPEMEIKQSFTSFAEERVVPFSTGLRKGLIY